MATHHEESWAVQNPETGTVTVLARGEVVWMPVTVVNLPSHRYAIAPYWPATDSLTVANLITRTGQTKRA